MKSIGSKKIVSFMIVAMVLLVGTACGGRIRVGERQTKTESVALGDASEVRVEVQMGAGELNVSGGAEGLMDADFVYNVAEWEPEVSYNVSGDSGRLIVEQPSTDIENLGIPDGDVEYRWDIRLGADVPIDLNIEMGAGQNNLDLRSLNLENLDIQTGAGETDVNVGGSLSDLEMQMGAGQVRLNLNDDWQQDLRASLRGGVGELTLLLPAETGVQVNVTGGIGDVNATGLSRDGDSYVNDAYGQSEVTLDIDVEGGVGEITLQVVE